MERFAKREIDSGTFPAWAEFTPVPDSETLVDAGNDFVFDLSEVRLGSSWRLRPSGTILYVEYWTGAAWVEKGRYTA